MGRGDAMNEMEELKRKLSKSQYRVETLKNDLEYKESCLDAMRFNCQERERFINSLICEKVNLRDLLGKAQINNTELLKHNLELEQANNQQLGEIMDLTEAIAKLREMVKPAAD
jgi:predicted  nucleic acid-binding Zn-ribbon protein